MCVLEAQKLTDMRESKLQTIISLKQDDLHGLILVGVRSAVKYEKAVQVIPIYILPQSPSV